MLFNSIEYLIFLPLVVACYFALPHRFRWVLLLITSYYFYMSWKAEYAILIMISTLIDYVAGLGMERAKTQAGKRWYLGFSLASNTGILFFFKYAVFFNESFRAAFARFDLSYHIPHFDILLPVGISFYTFQSLSYTVDVYRGHRKAEHHFGVFAVYVCFFPQLVAGPIERAVSFLPQFHEVHRIEYRRMADGLRLVLWGLFKKLVVADRVSLYVDSVYNNAYQHDSSLTFVLATYLFAFQIYCDFSAYSDIAIGSARMMGFDLMENFRRPYASRSVGEFWRRWHISLSTWFRDYVFIPLGGSQVGQRRRMANLFIVFLVSGLWHGANWTFVIWGALHGFYIVAGILLLAWRERLWARLGGASRPRFRACVEVALTFHLVCLGWIFFRANTVSDAFHIVGSILSFNLSAPYIGEAAQFLYGLTGIAALLSLEYLQGQRTTSEMFHELPAVGRWAIYVACVFGIMLLGVFDGGQFIYFQF
jgi:D-alanyl-lipoteichoic acid acyltransferase DltB (MBOAT superfamily)